MSKLIVKEHYDSRFSKMIRFYSKEFPIDRVRVARLISTGVRSPVCQPTDIKIVEVRYVTYISIVVSDVTSAVHIRRQTAWNTPKALDWIQDIESTNNARPRKTLWTLSRFKCTLKKFMICYKITRTKPIYLFFQFTYVYIKESIVLSSFKYIHLEVFISSFPKN